MKYLEFVRSIMQELQKCPSGLTWRELKSRLNLPYSIPCQTWITKMEQENGLMRVKGPDRAFVWKAPTYKKSE